MRRWLYSTCTRLDTIIPQTPPITKFHAHSSKFNPPNRVNSPMIKSAKDEHEHMVKSKKLTSHSRLWVGARIYLWLFVIVIPSARSYSQPQTRALRLYPPRSLWRSLTFLNAIEGHAGQGNRRTKSLFKWQVGDIWKRRRCKPNDPGNQWTKPSIGLDETCSRILELSGGIVMYPLILLAALATLNLANHLG